MQFNQVTEIFFFYHAHMNEKMNTPAASTAEQQTEELQLTAKNS